MKHAEKAPVVPEKQPRLSLRGRPLLIVRVAWMTLAVLTLGVFAVSVPVYFHRYIQTISLSERVALERLSISTRFYAGYAIALDSITILVFSFTAAMIFWRKSDDRVALLVSTALLTIGVAITPTLDVLAKEQPVWQVPVLIVRGLGLGSLLFVFYLFPDGKFVPRWTRLLAFIWLGWLLLWALFPTHAPDPEHLSRLQRGLIYLLSPNTMMFGEILRYVRLASLLMVLLVWFGSGVFAQIYRYGRVSGPAQRQQTKWVVFGLTAAVVGYFGYQVPVTLFPLYSGGLSRVLFALIGDPISVLLLLLAPVAIMLSTLHRRLWDIDPIIQRTLLYGVLTTTLGVLYFGSVLLFQYAFRALTGYQSALAIAVTTLIISALFRPLRARLQDFIDRRFYRERVDFRRAMTNFSREVRTLIELPELLHVLVERTTDMLHIAHGAVFLRDPGGAFQLVEARNLPPGCCRRAGATAGEAPNSPPGEEVVQLPLESGPLAQLQIGRVVLQPNDPFFPLLVPLTAPRTEGSELVGMLALGPRLSGQDYSREDQALLLGLADQAGTAIHVARLIQERQAEAERREEVERRLEAYRNSPVGRAETFAQTLLAAPDTVLIALHQLTQDARHDPDTASLLGNLSRVLDSVGEGSIALLAEGFDYLNTSHYEPEVLPVGLRTLVAQLESPAAAGWQYASETLAVYRLCQEAINADTIAQITESEVGSWKLEVGLDVSSQPPTSSPQPPAADLARALAGLHAVVEALRAYERLDTPRDKLAYLASAVERLRRVEYQARTELGGADRPILRRVAEDWLSVVTGAMSELQTRAQVICQLLTRHTWQGDVVSLALNLRNEGRGAALNVAVTLAPAPEYTVLGQAARIERLAPGEEARVELRVRPHLAGGADQFRARFVILYTDPRGPDQVEHFADVVRLLAVEGEFRFIPNPYVVGAPLETGSRLFFGREDVLAFVQENLTAHHRNNLVLIGQRRTGKTSLLKQLPVRLGDDYLPVYLDGQALGLDPGLPNFFLTVATEIAFALEDRGFAVGPPQAEQFAASPAATFERDFLTRVRAAIGERHLLVMFDEFEELESAARRGSLDPSVFGFLRHLVQHSRRLSVIFCGTHRLEELAADYWSVLFNISLYRHIAFLEKPEALRLVQEPVAEYGMRYDDLALDKIWQVTAGHPYFLQLLCHSLVNRHNKGERSYVTVADVNAALDDILASGEAHFVYLWAEATREERLVLATLSRMIPLSDHASPVQIADYLAERGVSVERRAIADALHRLSLRDILTTGGEADPAIGEVYRWKLGLLGLWVEKYRSLSRVMDEVRDLTARRVGV